MKLQEKIEEFIRESDLIEDSIIKEVIDKLPKNKLLADNAFISGFEYACECVLNLLETYKINPELNKRG